MYVKAGLPTIIEFYGGDGAAVPGDMVVFLPSSDAQECSGATYRMLEQGGLVPWNRRVTVTLPTHGYYGLCQTTVPVPADDADFTFVAGIMVIAMVTPAASTPSPPYPPPPSSVAR